MLWYLGKLIQNLLDNKWVWRLWELCEYFGYFKGFCETTWNWTAFWFYVNCELFMFLPLGRDMWLPDNYLARYYSLCDIDILAPSLWWLWVPALCRQWALCQWWVLALCQRWVSALCQQISFGFVSAIVMWPWLRFSGLEWCCYCSQCIVRSFMLRYFEEYIVCNFLRASWEVLCCVNLFILVLLFLEMVSYNLLGNLQIITCFVNRSSLWNLHFPHPY